MNDKFERKVKLGQKYFYDCIQPEGTSAIIKKVYSEIAKPCRSKSPVSSDSSSRSSMYRSNSSRRCQLYKSFSINRSNKRLSRASRRSCSSEASVSSESMRYSPNVHSKSSKDRAYNISPESRYAHSFKTGSQDRFGSIKNNSSYSRSRPKSRSSSKKKKSKKKHENRRSKSKSNLNDYLETKKYKYKGKRSSSSRSKSPSVSYRKLKHRGLKKRSHSKSFSESSDSSISSQRSTHKLKKLSGDFYSSSSINDGMHSQHQYNSHSLKNLQQITKSSRSQSHKPNESLSPSHYQLDTKSHITSHDQKDSLFSNYINNYKSEPNFQLLNKLTNVKQSSEECSEEEIQKFFQNLTNLKEETGTSVKKKQLSPKESVDITKTFSKLQFNQYLKSCSTNIDLKTSNLADSPTMSLKEEMNIFLSNAVIQESIKSLRKKESNSCIGENFLSTTKCKDTLKVAKEDDLPKKIVNAFNGRDNNAQIISDSVDLEVVCIDSDSSENIPEYESTGPKTSQLSISASPSRIQLKTSENIFFSVYKETLVYLKNHENLLGMYASVIGPLLLDLCSTYGSELTLDHKIALTLILDMLRLNISLKSLSITDLQYHKEAMSKIENVLLHYSGIETDFDSYPSFLYGYDVNDLACKMVNKNATETKRFIDCLLLHDGFENTNLEPFNSLYEQVEIKKAKIIQN